MKKALYLSLFAIILLTIGLTGCMDGLQQEIEKQAAAKESLKADVRGPASDSIILKNISEEDAVSELLSGDMDYYLTSITPEQAVELKDNPDIKFYYAYPQFTSIAFNPAPGDGKQLNPFSLQKVRFAMNYLIDKEKIVDEVYKGFGVPVAANMIEEHPSYKLIKDIIDKYDFKYDKEKADSLIKEAMDSAGAEKIEGKWSFKGEPIVLYVYIDKESKESKKIIEMICEEIENIGFKVEKNYYERDDKEFENPVSSTDADELKWHFYLTGWIYYGASKYTGFSLPGFYAKEGWWDYNNTKINDVKEKLKSYSSKEEWEQLNKELTKLYLEDSQGIWLAAKQAIFAVKSNVNGIVEDEYVGIRSYGNIRQAYIPDKSELVIGSKYLYEEDDSWNPVVIKHIAMMDVVNTIHDPVKWTDPALETKPFRWDYSIKISDSLYVPEDAFIWDVKDKKWVNVKEKVQAKSKITFDLSDYIGAKWHHGQEISWADILYFISATWDRAYDEEKQRISSERWQDYFEPVKGIRVFGNNLVVYLDKWDFDEENLLGFAGMFQRSAPLEIYAGSDKLVFGGNGFEYGEEDDDEFEKLSLVNKEHIEKALNELDSMEYSEIAPFVSANGISYFTASEFNDRKAALHKWFDEHRHLIISDGAFYMDKYDNEAGDIILKAFRDENYPFKKGSNYYSKESGASVSEEEFCAKKEAGEKMSFDEAKEIALGSECAKEGLLEEKHWCNEITGTWWIDLDIEKQGCSPACVINVATKEAEINWMCTGLIMPEKPKEEPVAEQKSLEVAAADQKCEADDDCIMVMVKCSCDCGVPINKANWQKYLDKQEKMCEDYEGPMCKMMCNQKLRCINKVCSVLEE